MNFFYRIALERSLIDSSVPISKQAVRDHLRQRGQEAEWIELQGLVYGARMNEAEPYPGVIDFISELLLSGIQVSIISHKTKTPYAGPPYDLHAAAGDWLSARGLGISGPLEKVTINFELTREEKLQRIERRNCSAFIDDLPEFLGEPAFPQRTQKVLFDPCNVNEDNIKYLRVNSWLQISQFLQTSEARAYVG